MKFLSRLFEILDNKFFVLKETVLRKSPSHDAPVILKLIEGHELELITGGDDDTWTLVRLNDDVLGYVESAKITTFKPQTAVVSGREFISEERLRLLTPRGKPELIKAIVTGQSRIFAKYGLVARQDITHFLATILIESAYFSRLEENLNYRADRLREVFPTRFTLADAVAYAGQPAKIANRAYALKIGNGDETSGDGWKYRGRGFIQLTGRANYRDMGRFLGLDLERNPDYVLQPSVALEVSCMFFQVRGCLGLSDMRAVTKRVNPALMHLKERVEMAEKLIFKQIF